MAEIETTVIDTVVVWSQNDGDFATTDSIKTVWEGGARFRNGQDLSDPVLIELITSLNRAFDGRLKEPLRPRDITGDTTSDDTVEMIRELLKGA